jgi:hypothetical protein
MDPNYKTYCVESIKNMLEDGKGGNIGQIYKFLTHNSEFVENHIKFKETSISKAKVLILEVIEKIKEKEGIEKSKLINIKKNLEEFLEKFDKNS